LFKKTLCLKANHYSKQQAVHGTLGHSSQFPKGRPAMKPEIACFAEASLEPDAVFTSLAACLPASPQPVPFAQALLVMLLQGF
jgi:hypothetical protein